MAYNQKEPMSRQSATAPSPIKPISGAERAAIIDRIAGSLTSEEGDELARIIEEACERVDEHNR